MSNDSATASDYLAGWCVMSVHKNGSVLDARFDEIKLFENVAKSQAVAAMSKIEISETLRLITQTESDKLRNVSRKSTQIVVDINQPPKSVQDAYIRLTALSQRILTPNSINLDGLFSVLSNVVWTNFGPCLQEDIEEVRVKLYNKYGFWPEILCVDKIPRMVDYFIPDHVRIADVNRVRLGAYLAPGTTVMHEGFCNFNAGTLGVSMVEGRISQGVVVHDDADIGGGASIMGTLSGGGKQRVSIGKRSLLGANAGLGISLGEDCIVESGLYLTAGSKVEYNGEIVKARELNGRNKLLFIRDSQSGKLLAKDRKIATPESFLNESLHKN